VVFWVLTSSSDVIRNLNDKQLHNSMTDHLHCFSVLFWFNSISASVPPLLILRQFRPTPSLVSTSAILYCFVFFLMCLVFIIHCAPISIKKRAKQKKSRTLIAVHSPEIQGKLPRKWEGPVQIRSTYFIHSSDSQS